MNEDCISFEILLACVCRNPNVYEKIDPSYLSQDLSEAFFNHDVRNYRKIPRKYITQEMSQRFFEYDIFNYMELPYKHITQEMSNKFFVSELRLCTWFKYIPDQHITLEMVIEYILSEDVEYDYDSIPVRYRNHPELFDIVLSEKTGAKYIKDIPFKFLNKELCTMAVKSNSSVFKYIPFVFVDKQMCKDAIASISVPNIPDAYISEKTMIHEVWNIIPYAFKTVEMKEHLIKFHPCMIGEFYGFIKPNEITHNMMLSVFRYFALNENNKNMISVHNLIQNSNVSGLIRCNIKEYIDVYENLHRVIDADYFYRDNALYPMLKV